jgi:hypothetical protein
MVGFFDDGDSEIEENYGDDDELLAVRLSVPKEALMANLSDEEVAAVKKLVARWSVELTLLLIKHFQSAGASFGTYRLPDGQTYLVAVGQDYYRAVAVASHDAIIEMANSLELDLLDESELMEEMGRIDDEDGRE